MSMIHCSCIHQEKNGNCSHNKMLPFVSKAELVIIPMGQTQVYKSEDEKETSNNNLDETSKAVDINIHRHYTLVQLIPYMFCMTVLCIYSEDAFHLQGIKPTKKKRKDSVTDSWQ